MINVQNGKNISTPQKAHVCIIGSGPAGITAAYELSKAGLDVLLLDGGRQLNYSGQYYPQSWNDKVRFYNGLADGLFSNESQFLILGYDQRTANFPIERERVYGGTSTHWGGQNRPLDPIAFKKRQGFPGWPITREDLDPYYAKASALNHLFGDYGTNSKDYGKNFTAEFWVDEMKKQGLQAAIPQLTNFNTEMYQFMSGQWLNFATRTFDGKTIDSYVRVIVNATLLNIVEQGGSVQYLNVASMNDDQTNPQKATEFTVTADVYILALGSVENARQLLLSGVGNDLVGHYFGCHPLSQWDIITPKQTYLSQAESNLAWGTGWQDPTGNINGIQARFIMDEATATEKGIGRCWFWAPNPQAPSQPSRMYFEMAPNYNSYVTLLTKDPDPPVRRVGPSPPAKYTDPVFGQPLTHIHWEFTDLDRLTYKTNCELFDQAAASKFSSIISWPDWETLINEWTVNGHHIGTTRMSASTEPAEGVVDQNLKIHGIDNMYVAGASVFCGTGLSNPTMTIITLSIRLGEYLKNEVFKTSTS